MAFSSSTRQIAATPNITPLIDVLLVLLIIFMVISPTQQSGLTGLLPSEVPATTAASHEPLTVEVLPGPSPNMPLYRVAGRDFDLVGIRRQLAFSRALQDEREVWVSGDPRIDYQAVVSVIAEAKTAGFERVGLRPQFSSVTH